MLIRGNTNNTLSKEQYIGPEGRYEVKGGIGMQNNTGDLIRTGNKAMGDITNVEERIDVEMNSLKVQHEGLENTLNTSVKVLEKLLKKNVNFESERAIRQHYFELREELKKQLVLVKDSLQENEGHNV